MAQKIVFRYTVKKALTCNILDQKNITPEEEKRYAELQKLALDFARRGETEELQKMIDAGMPVDLANEKGQSLLMLVSYNGRL